MRRAALSVGAVGIASLAAGFGLGWYAGPGPERRYCDECREIVQLQAKPARTAVDVMAIDQLKEKLIDKERNLAAYGDLAGRPPDLHPECECACHRYWLNPKPRPHDEEPG